ncbi:hypothetical protein [Helicobacter fennelliae]|uniref:hypothetical protein n=1 Tax=Helicobacter fennelliae TaxID=215 RepID=UPI0011BE0BBA|nr:hypothetical protein [Helicobacter fennelliae]
MATHEKCDSLLNLQNYKNKLKIENFLMLACVCIDSKSGFYELPRKIFNFARNDKPAPSLRDVKPKQSINRF